MKQSEKERGSHSAWLESEPSLESVEVVERHRKHIGSGRLLSPMRIGEVAAEAAVNVQTLRYYERVGLLPRPDRQDSGYRAYDAHAVRRVRFIKCAQELGFSLTEIGDLLALREHSRTACRHVEAQATTTLQRINDKIRNLERIRAALSMYVDSCRKGPPIGECPLLQALDRSID